MPNTSPRTAPRHAIVVGAGPGGLTAAMILAHRGVRVTVVEKAAEVGGRNGEIRIGANGEYRHDIGPTFLMMKFLLDEMFHEVGRRSSDYLDFVELDPMYRLDFGDRYIEASPDPRRMREEIERAFPGEGAALERFMEAERVRFEKMYPCLQKDYSSPSSLVRPVFLSALPHLALGRSLYGNLARYFQDERLRLAFTFQSKYLGMSPWSCPAAFTIIPYLEHAYGIWHVQGGLTRISHAMAKVVEEEGGEIRLNAPIRRVLLQGRQARGVELENGERIEADAVFVNADFGHAMRSLAEPGSLRKWTPEKLARSEFSCSTFMLYLGLDTIYDLPHHTVCFASDYRRNLNEITKGKTLSKEISFYVRNASVLDPHVAPAGHSSMYVLVPAPNNESGIDWVREAPAYRELVLDSIERRLGISDLRSHIRAERVVTPLDWETQFDVFKGATFNLAHTLDQMLYFRPRNRFEEWENVFLVGGGTHPGSGLPTIYESGRISANLFCDDLGIGYQAPDIEAPAAPRYAAPRANTKTAALSKA